MSDQVRIEIQDQFGKWNFYKNVVNMPTSIKQGLESALRTQLAQKSKKVRAVDANSGRLIDLLQG